MLLDSSFLGLGEALQQRLVLLLEEADEQQLAAELVLLPVRVRRWRREVVGVGVDDRGRLGGWRVGGERRAGGGRRRCGKLRRLLFLAGLGVSGGLVLADSFTLATVALTTRCAGPWP